ncbi:Double zinc ribbon [Butyrivibrio sp. Su6]|uniref:zinc ribbon domain-containing protein n=1 Tax=Butyrivibrio sp. Su6 TaxID=1520810 RepID=UPI00089F3A1B|nr:zinc ribbon domain-containing protein [Butyrivibrio sp. Su6]SEG08767.1 Double zinc ribbon [Butyrivibrio sp. Su6]
MVKCVKCGCEQSDDANFCMKCGTPIVRKPICPKCKKELPEGSNFCRFCGTSLKQGIWDDDSSLASGEMNMKISKNIVDTHTQGQEKKATPFATYIEDPRKFGKNTEFLWPSYNVRLFEDWSAMDDYVYSLTTSTSSSEMHRLNKNNNEKSVIWKKDCAYDEGFVLNNIGFFCKAKGSNRLFIYDIQGETINEFEIQGKIMYVYDEFVYTVVGSESYNELYGGKLDGARIIEYSVISGKERDVVNGSLLKVTYEKALKHSGHPFNFREYEGEGSKAEIVNVFVNDSRIYIYVVSHDDREYGHIVIDRHTNKITSFRANSSQWCNLINNTIYHFDEYADGYGHDNSIKEYVITPDGSLCEKDDMKVWKCNIGEPGGFAFRDTPNRYEYFDGDNAINYESVFNQDGWEIRKLRFNEGIIVRDVKIEDVCVIRGVIKLNSKSRRFRDFSISYRTMPYDENGYMKPEFYLEGTYCFSE